jgi:phospholipid/cholesterol/gamma-HCH transport system permease protein
MMTNPALSNAVLAPLAWIGRRTLAGVSYLGGLATLGASAVRSLVRPAGEAPAFGPALMRQLGWMLGMGFPLVGLVHVGMGSFLSMQAYFGGTFVDGTGAVVGVGLVRNLAPLMTGLTLAGLIAARTTSELRGRSRVGLDGDPGWVADREIALGRRADPRRAPEPGRLAAVRIAAAMIVGPVLVSWAVAVGTLVGWQVSRTLLGVSTHAFFYMFQEMLWVRDVVGLAIKGIAFAWFAALFACHEGLRGPTAPDPDSVPAAACRATCLAAVAILALNSGWFLLLYHAGPAFGPTLLAPPAP